MALQIRATEMPTCRHLCCLLLSKAVSASRRSDSQNSAAVAAAPGGTGESPRRKVVVNEIASGAASVGVAVCCFPLAIVYSILLLIVGCPCSLLFKFARNAKTRYQTSRRRRRRTRPSTREEEKPALFALPACEEEKSGLLALPSARVDENISDLHSHFPSHGWEFSFGFGMKSGGRTMAFQADIDCDRLLSRVPALIKQKIGELKKKRLGATRRRRRGNDGLSCHRLPEECAVNESPLRPSSSSGSPGREQSPLCGRDGERGREMVAKGFEHPFWQEHFEGEGSQLGFWRGLDLRDS